MAERRRHVLLESREEHFKQKITLFHCSERSTSETESALPFHDETHADRSNFFSFLFFLFCTQPMRRTELGRLLFAR